MNLLMITRKVDKDDGLAGFVFNWVKKIGENTKNLYVICLEKGNVEGLPENVKILPIRNNNVSNNVILRKITDFLNFQKLAFKIIKKVDGVFCHMNPEYTISVWPLVKMFNKKIVSWYAHGTVSLRLKLLEKMANKIVTPSQKSFRLKSKKVIITGHGIDINKFKKTTPLPTNKFKIISVGRISPTKDLETLIKAINVIVNDYHQKDIVVEIIGSPGLKSHETYLESLKKMVEKMNLGNYIKFLGSIANKKIPQKLNEAQIFINLSNTGSVDKAVLEAMATEVVPITSNIAFKEILEEKYLTKANNYKMLSQKIIHIKNEESSEQENLKKKLREIIVENHNLDKLIKKILNQFKP
jgi:glycosyltransferase involved in cell wall biosynthesis